MPYFGSDNGNRNEDSDLICAGLELPTKTSSQNGVAVAPWAQQIGNVRNTTDMDCGYLA
jgi:hypothetical protein